MRFLRSFFSRLLGSFPNERRERDRAAEIEANLQLHTDENVRRGMPPAEARRQAVLKLGGIEPVKEAYRDRNGLPLLENLLRDFRFALRQLGTHPGFTATAVIVLALGIAASVSIFAFVDAALIKPLPYRDSARLVGVYEKVPMFPQSNLSYLDYLDWKKMNTVFQSLDAYQHYGYILSASAGPEPINATRVSDGFFNTLGVTPAVGRSFHPGEDLPSAQQTVLLSYAAWQKRFAGNLSVVGQKMILDGVPAIIIGVLPADFHFAPGEPAEIWTTLHAERGCDLRRSCHNLYGIARLKDGVSLSTALANVTAIAQQLERQYPVSNKGQDAAVAELSDVIVGQIKPLLLILWAGAALLLLIACVNVANLLLVRSEARSREIAVRTALGASTARLLNQFFAESLLLVVGGGVLGLAVATWVMNLLVSLIPKPMFDSLPFLHQLGLNGRVLGFAGLIALGATIVFSLTPAVRLLRSDTKSGLAEGSRGSAGLTWRRLGSKLVLVELATAVVLLAGAGLLGKSLFRLLDVDLGMQPDHLATLSVFAPQARYSKPEQTAPLCRKVVEEIDRLPGVKSAALTTLIPVSGNGNTSWIRFPGRAFHGEHNEVNSREVSSAYFTTIGARLLRGRMFTDEEDFTKPKVVVINRKLASQYFPNEDPIGKQIGDTELTPKSLKRIIGVVEDIREAALDGEIWAAIYQPINQDDNNGFTVVARTTQNETSLLPAMSAAVRQIDQEVVTLPGAAMKVLISDSPSAYMHRSAAWLVGGFAALALLLGVVGLYGVIAYSVSWRTREIGIRMALGAQRSTVYSMILREAGSLTVAGLVIGLLCSLAAARLMGKLLFGVSSWDLPTLLLVSGVLGTAALGASFLPARRAASIDPANALRSE